MTLRCLGKPITAPPPPPTLELLSVPRARVYRVDNPVPGETVSDFDACNSLAESASVGQTPLEVTGVKKGKQSFCFIADGYAPRRITVDVARSGPTRPDVVRLIPFARVGFDWGSDCPYRRAPAEVQLVVDEEPFSRQSFPIASRPLSPGEHKFSISADGFESTSLSIVVDRPGSPEVRKSICLDPGSRITISNSRHSGAHPLDGLFLRAQDEGGELLWQGSAPAGKTPVSVPVRPADRVVISVFTDREYLAQIPKEFVRFEDSKDRLKADTVRNSGATLVAKLILPHAPLPPANRIDRATMTKACLAGDEYEADYCASEAYLRVYRDKRHLSDPKIQELLKSGCEKGSVTSCIARKADFDAVVVLARTCHKSARSDAWLACVRLRQLDLQPREFLYFDGTVRTPDDRVAEVGADGFLCATIEQRPGFLVSGALSFRFFVNKWFAVGGALRLLDVAALPAHNSSGDPDGYFALGGAGLEVALSARPVDPLRLTLAAFMAGYYTASASTTGGYAGVGVAVAPEHFLSLRGGVARFPRIVAAGPDTHEPQGGVVRPFTGVAYTFMTAP